MKRRREICKDDIPFTLKDGDHILIRSFNFPDQAWGWRSGDPGLSIVKSKKYQRVFTVNTSHSQCSSILLSVQDAMKDAYIDVDVDSFDVTVGNIKTKFTMDVIGGFGDSLQVRFITKDKRYLRHSNYKLRADCYSISDKPLLEDSTWLISKVESDSVSTAPSSPSACQRSPSFPIRPLFIHLESCFSTNEESHFSLDVLNEFANGLLNSAIMKSRNSPNIFSPNNDKRVLSYSLQGAGGMTMEAAAMAISMYRPGESVSVELQKRIEDACTVKSRGGMSSFTQPTEQVAQIIKRISNIALSEMKRLRMFGMVARRDFEMELGFCEWVILPHDSEIVPHRDGGNDCDVAAIYACANACNVSVEETTLCLKPGNMYIFEPQKYTHSVSKPMWNGPRVVVALRFFKTYM